MFYGWEGERAVVESVCDGVIWYFLFSFLPPRVSIFFSLRLLCCSHRNHGVCSLCPSKNSLLPYLASMLTTVQCLRENKRSFIIPDRQLHLLHLFIVSFIYSFRLTSDIIHEYCLLTKRVTRTYRCAHLKQECKALILLPDLETGCTFYWV